MRIAIFPFRKFEGRKQIGSSTIRCDWLLNHWEEAEEFKYGKPYDVIIYQKIYWPDHAKLFKGIKILDLCDPDWMHWGYRTKEMINEMDAITCSSELLAKDVSSFTRKPVIYIPDRVDLDFFKKKKEHNDRAKKVAWFGYGYNFLMLDPVIGHLLRNKLELKVISEMNYHLPAGYSKLKCDTVEFDWNTLARELLWADFVVNPKSETGKWRYKSENKTVISWALGLPVAKNPDDIKKFLDPKERQREADKRYLEVKDKSDVKLSVDQLKVLIKKIKEEKNV